MGGHSACPSCGTNLYGVEGCIVCGHVVAQGVCKRCGCGFVRKPKTTVQAYCSKECRYLQWVESNRESLNAKVREYRARRYRKEGRWRDEGPKAKALKKWMVDLKSGPCCDCGGVFEVCCMDFDHRVGTDKTYNIGSMFAHHYSVDIITAELSKCDLVCANCHRIRTRDRRTGSGKNA